jgi:hypothetical protein
MKNIAGALLLVAGAGCSGPAAPVDATTGADASIDAALPDTSVAADGSVGADTSIADDASIAPDAASTSSFPTDPIAFTAEDPFTLDSGTTNYVFVPSSYDATHHTPTTLFVWLHGCGGFSSGDIWTVSPGGTQSWISLAVGGAEGSCWDVDGDPARVLAAIDELATHFNIAPHHIILGGYSSGGDLGYRTAFYDASRFAGVLAENTSPFRDTGSSMAASLAAASWRFNVVHLAHLQDDTYPIAGVRSETEAMIAAGFPLMRIEVDGGHYDDAGAIENGHAVPGTSADLATYLFPYLDMGWTSP